MRPHVSPRPLRARRQDVPEARPLIPSRDPVRRIGPRKASTEDPNVLTIEANDSDLYRIVLRCTVEVNTQ
jgi:hypothetical protein